MCHCCNSMKKDHQHHPARKTRTRTRKPKYLSLRQQIPQETDLPMTPNPSENELNLFPLHPENLFNHLTREPEDKEINENVAWFLDPEGSLSEGGTTINGLLGTSSDDLLEPSSSVYDYGLEASRNSYNSAGSRRDEALAGALRQNGWTHGCDEKWVVYADVAACGVKRSAKAAEEEVSSVRFSAALDQRQHQAPKLSLKLDYEDILNAWSDKGPLYIEGECPQTVPDLEDRANAFMDVGSVKNVKLWRVPEDGCSVIEDGGEGKMGQREARVLRYKEKRRSRLFSKRIRYEVRKLNAEKRPRMKGRFVKRKAEV